MSTETTGFPPEPDLPLPRRTPGKTLEDRIAEAVAAERERVVQLIHLIRVLHKPVKAGRWLTCHGCDQGPHPEDYPDWPCSTAELVFTPEERAQAEAGLLRQDGKSSSEEQGP